MAIPRTDDKLAEILAADEMELKDLDERWNRITGSIQAILHDLDELGYSVQRILEDVTILETDLRVDVERALADRGFDATKLKEFQELDRQASLQQRYADTLVETRHAQGTCTAGFSRLQDEPRVIAEDQRHAFDRVITTIEPGFGNRIRVQRIENGDIEPLGQFLEMLRQKGVTRWWIGLSPDCRPSPEELAGRLEDGTLKDVGMSVAVQDTFRESMTRSRKRELTVLRCPNVIALNCVRMRALTAHSANSREDNVSACCSPCSLRPPTIVPW